MTDKSFIIAAHWQRREESPSSLAMRVSGYLARARAAIPNDLRWFTQGKDLVSLCHTDEGMIGLEDDITQGVTRGEDGTYPHLGFRYKFHLAAKDPAPSF